MSSNLSLNKSKYLLGLLCILFFSCLIFLSFYANGTGDEGDSVLHFIVSKASWKHHELFLYHWGKPVFILLTSPIAQLGFTAFKIFNSLCSVSAVIIAIYIARKLNIERTEVLPIMAAFMPQYVYFTLSGLTEPLFALWLIIGILLFIKKNWIVGSLWISFLPFVRSEGLVVLVVIAAYFIFEKKYKYIPVLMFGHVVFSIVGKFFGKNFLWVFTEMTYAQLESGYGKGTWGWFFYNIPVMLGVICTILLCIGLLYGLNMTIRSIMLKNKNSINEIFLVYGIASAVFLFHAFAWGIGWFGSIGLLRVIVGIMPLLMIICMKGLNLIIDNLPNKFQKSGLLIIIILIIALPLIGGKYGYQYKNQFLLNVSQRTIKMATDFIKINYADYEQKTFCYEAPYTAIALNHDYYNEKQHRIIRAGVNHLLPTGTIMIWDDWYAKVQGNIALDTMKSDTTFIEKGMFKDLDQWGNERVCLIFEKVR